MKILLFSAFIFLSSFSSDRASNNIDAVTINNMELTVATKYVPGDCTVTVSGVCGTVSATSSNCKDARSAAIAAYMNACIICWS